MPQCIAEDIFELVEDERDNEEHYHPDSEYAQLLNDILSKFEIEE